MKIQSIFQMKPRLGQRKAGLRCKIKILIPTSVNKPIAQMMENPPKVLAPNSPKVKDTVYQYQ